MKLGAVGAACFLLGAGLGYALGRAAERESAPAAPASASDTAEPTDAGVEAALDAASDGDTPTDDATADPDTADAGPRWTALETHDEMRGTTTRSMCIRASSDLRLRFPYADARASFCFRDSPEHGRDAFLIVTEGQILCGYRGCSAAVRFDDEEVETFRAAGGESNSRILFIRDADSFARRALSASRFVVEVNFHDAGRRQVTFEDTQGLEWEIPAPTRRVLPRCADMVARGESGDCR